MNDKLDGLLHDAMDVNMVTFRFVQNVDIALNYFILLGCVTGT